MDSSNDRRNIVLSNSDWLNFANKSIAASRVLSLNRLFSSIVFNPNEKLFSRILSQTKIPVKIYAAPGSTRPAPKAGAGGW